MPELSEIADTSRNQREINSTVPVAHTARTEEVQVKLDSSSGPKFPVKYMETEAAYDLWAEVYDTDGNFLQALDSLEMKTLLPEFMDIPFISGNKEFSPRSVSPWKVVDLGCGTGRTTMKLLEYSQAQIYGLDVSEQMLKIAKAKTAKFQGKSTFIVFDVLAARGLPEELSDQLCAGADSVVSSLVIEHLPLDGFFRAVKMLLNPNGTLLLTNMHSDMGAISQAGFVDPYTGTKIRPKSYFHTIPEVLQAATRAGFFQVGEIREKEVTPEMVEILGPRAKKWVGVAVWFSICFRLVQHHI